MYINKMWANRNILHYPKVILTIHNVTVPQNMNCQGLKIIFHTQPTQQR